MTRAARVNLLPEAVRLRNAARPRGRSWCIVFCATAMVSGLAWQWSSRYSGEVRTADSELENTLAELHRQKKLASTINLRGVEVQKRYAILEAMCGPQPWSPRVAIIARSVPPGMVLTRFNLASRSDGPDKRDAEPPKDSAAAPQARDEILIDGYTLAHVDIAMFLRRLKESRLFSRVDLVRSVRESKQEQVVLSFGISCSR